MLCDITLRACRLAPFSFLHPPLLPAATVTKKPLDESQSAAALLKDNRGAALQDAGSVLGKHSACDNKYDTKKILVGQKIN